MKLFQQAIVISIFTLLLSSCGGSIKQAVVRDSGPTHAVDVSQIKDAVVKHEPQSRYGNPDFYDIAGVRYFVLNSAVGYRQKGVASWYGRKFHGRRTSNGEIYDMYAMTAAHPTLPLPTYVQVTNLSNGKMVIVKVNDRGPFHNNRILDLSYAAASKLDVLKTGTAMVEVVALTPGIPKIGGKEGYLVQIGAYSDHEKSTKLAQSIESELATRIEISAIQTSEQLLYRLRIGPFLSKEEASQWLNKIIDKGFPNARLVTITDRWQNL